jgi:phosphohistidine phosphatase
MPLANPARLWFENNMTVMLYLMRHGIAADAGRGMADADRALTPEGVSKTTRVAEGLRVLGLEPDAILSSPLRRAEETARIAAKVLAPRCAIELTSALAGGQSAPDVAAALHPPRQARHVLLVGHQPDLGDLASFLLTGSAQLAPLPFRKAAVAAIEVSTMPPRSTGILHWFLTPAQLRAIAQSQKSD